MIPFHAAHSAVAVASAGEGKEHASVVSPPNAGQHAGVASRTVSRKPTASTASTSASFQVLVMAQSPSGLRVVSAAPDSSKRRGYCGA